MTLTCRSRLCRPAWLPVSSHRQSVQIRSASSTSILCPGSQRGLCLLPQEENSSAISAPSGLLLLMFLILVNIILCLHSPEISLMHLIWVLTHIKSLSFSMYRTQTPVSWWSTWDQSRKCGVILWALPLLFCLLTSCGSLLWVEMACYASEKLLPWWLLILFCYTLFL